MEFSSLPHADDRHAAEVERIVHCLQHYGGVLTKERLLETCNADRWPTTESFDLALSKAVKSGRVRRLTDELFEAA
jgi:hypothetical protein